MIVSAAVTGCATQISSPPRLAVEPQTDGPAWLNCDSDSECALIRDPSCYYISVNRDHAAEMTGRMAEDLEERGELRDCLPWSIDYVPVCRAGRCSTARPED